MVDSDSPQADHELGKRGREEREEEEKKRVENRQRDMQEKESHERQEQKFYERKESSKCKESPSWINTSDQEGADEEHPKESVFEPNIQQPGGGIIGFFTSHGKGNQDEPTKLSKHRREKEKLKEDISKLNQDIANYKSDVNSWRDRYIKEKGEREVEVMKIKRHYRDTIIEKDREISRLDSRCSNLSETKIRLENQNYKLVTNLNHSDRQHNNTKNEFEGYMRRAEGKERALMDRCKAIEGDNDGLRELINSKSRPQEPTHAEDFYIQSFDDLKSGIIDFIAKHSKQNSKETLTPATQTKILSAIAEFGVTGQATAQFLKLHLLPLYTSRQFRIHLLRHIVAIYLFDQIFNRFAYPVTPETSDYLRRIEDNLFCQGLPVNKFLLILDHDYNKLLMIRQSIARGVLASSEKLAPAAREEAIKKFPELLHYLLPKSRPGDLRDGVTKFMDKALALKKEMTQEQAVYRCFMVGCAQPVSEVEVDIGDDGLVSGTLLLCTFPGLMRLILNEDTIFEKTIVVRADGEQYSPIPPISASKTTNKSKGDDD